MTSPPDIDPAILEAAAMAIYERSPADQSPWAEAPTDVIAACMDDALAALRAAAPLLVKGETWQPIETAPKDGTAILLYREIDDDWVVAFWAKIASLGTGWHTLDSQRPHTSEWFSHWMALPARPIAAAIHERGKAS